jgi:proteasome lid subunit RPN8/RPN11
MTSPNKAIAIAKEPKVEIDSEVSRRIRQHARAHSKTEVCGVLIGEDANGIIEIRASIEALNAAQAGTHVTFTQDAWEAIYRVKDELYPEDRIVGWYHSHPGFGVFLSEHDMFI